MSDVPIDVLFTNTSFTIQNRYTKKVLVKGHHEHDLHILEHARPTLLADLRNNTLHATFEWHFRLGHVSPDFIFFIEQVDIFIGYFLFPKQSLCAKCQLEKSVFVVYIKL